MRTMNVIPAKAGIYRWIPTFVGMTAAAVLLILTGCNKSPFDRTRNASGGATGAITPNGSFVIFNSELISGGGAFEYPGSDGQSLSFNDTSNPISHRSIRYSWTGEPVSNPTGSGGLPNPESVFAGFDLMDTATFTDYGAPSNTGRVLHQAGYSKVTFYARGSLSTNTDLKIEAAGGSPQPCLLLSTSGTDNPGALPCMTLQLTGNWQSYSLFLPPGSLNAVKDFFKATFIFAPAIGAPAGQGGTVYFDVIQYQP